MGRNLRGGPSDAAAAADQGPQRAMLGGGGSEGGVAHEELAQRVGGPGKPWEMLTSMAYMVHIWRFDDGE